LIDDTSLSFMFIGRIASTMRGPMVAYYRSGRPMIYVSYNRDSKRDGTLISWDKQGRPLVIDQFTRGRRNGLRVLFRLRSENDPTGLVGLVQEWRVGKLSATHLVDDDGEAQTIDPEETLPTETNDELVVCLAELNQFDETIRENERELRKALTALYREQIRLVKEARTGIPQQQVQSPQAILDQLRSKIQAPGGGRP
jgi:hypothetical protein